MAGTALGGTQQVAFSAYCAFGTNKTIPDNTATIVDFPTERFDVGGYYNNSTMRFTPPPGRYVVTASADFSVISASAACYIRIFKNGTTIASSVPKQVTVANLHQTAVTQVVDIAAGDYLEIFAIQTSGVDATLAGSSTLTYFSASKV